MTFDMRPPSATTTSISTRSRSTTSTRTPTRRRSSGCSTCRREPGSRRALRPRAHRRRLAAAGMEVTGVDLTAAYLGHRRAPTVAPRGRVTYVAGGSPGPPRRRAVDAVVCWLNSFGYYDDADCHRVLEEFHRVLHPGREGGDRHDAPRRGRPPLHPGPRRGGRPARRRHHGRGLDLRSRAGKDGDRAHMHRAGAIPRASYFVRLPTPPEWVA